MADFDILGSLGVNIPNEPIHPITRSTELKVIAPREKPQAASPAVKPRDLKLDDLSASGSRTPLSSASAKEVRTQVAFEQVWDPLVTLAFNPKQHPMSLPLSWQR